MKITIVGAGNVGASAAKAIADKGIVNEIVLIDIIEGVPQGKALDIAQSAPCVGFDTKVTGTNNYADTANSDIVVITAGVARKPGMSRDDLLNINAGIIGGVVQQVAKSSPNSIIIAVTNPLDVMAYLAYKVSGFPKNRVIGMAGVLDTSRFRTFIAQECNVSVRDVYAFVLGGHGDSMVPCVDFTTVAGVPLKQILSQEKIDALVKRAQNGGGEIVALLKTGSAYYAPAQSVTEMVEAIVLDTNRILPCAAYLDGEYGIKGGYCGVPCKLGKGGLKEIVKVKLTDKEAELLKKSGEEVLSQIKAMEVLEGYTKLGIK